LTKTQLVALMAEKIEITKKQAASFFDILADLAVTQAKKNGVFVVPGLGRTFHLSEYPHAVLL
jgi:DNA-binding protein HU-beta